MNPKKMLAVIIGIPSIILLFALPPLGCLGLWVGFVLFRWAVRDDNNKKTSTQHQEQMAMMQQMINAQQQAHQPPLKNDWDNDPDYQP